MSKKQTLITLVSLCSLICFLLVLLCLKPKVKTEYITKIITKEREPIKEIVYIEKETIVYKENPYPAEMALPQCHTNIFYAEQDYLINDPNSHQWALKHDPNTYVKENGMYAYRWNDEDYFLVAMGYAYGWQIGLTYKITLENGTEFKVIMADFKGVPYGHECRNFDNEYCVNVIEFICDIDKLPEEVLWKGSFSAQEEYNADIKSIEVLGKIW